MAHVSNQIDEADLPHTEWMCGACGAANSCIDADCQFCDDAEKTATHFYTVAIYLIDRAYGGPEEGGWWYECGERQDRLDTPGNGNIGVPRIFSDEGEAIEFAGAQQRQLDYLLNNHRRSDIGSVLSQGRYVARVCENYPEPHFPAVKPHYE